MSSHPRRRDDRAAPADPSKQWIPTDKYPLDYESDRRRNRSATLPAHSYDPRSYPSHDTRYNDPRHPSRLHRQDPHYPPQASYSYHHSAAHAPSTSKAYQHATRPSAQHSSSNHHYPQPSSYHPPHPTTAYPVASSSRRPHPEAPDTRTSRRPPYDPVSGGEEMPRASARPSRPAHSSIQPSISAPPNQTFWNPQQEIPSRRHKDTYRDRDRDQDRERVREREKERDRDRDRDRPPAELESKYKDRTKTERYREREPERTADPRYQDSSRSRHHDRRKDSDAEGVVYSEQRNTSKASLSGREGYSSVREPGNGHRRHRTEDGTASTGRRHQPENTQNPITTMPSHSTTAPQPDVQQTGDPPPAPRVMPVYLPPKAKSQRSQRDGRPPTTQGAQSGSDTERATAKHRMERTPSGPAVQRSDAHTSTSTRDRSNHDLSMGPRDDMKRLEGKYGAHHDTRQPLAPINVDIPLVTPGFNASALPTETRASTVPQIVSIRAGQGPSDPHDAHFKSSHSNAPQEIATHPPHPTSASIVKSSSHARPQSSETRAQSDHPPAVVERSRTEPHVDDLPPGQRVSTHESSRALPTPVSRPSYSRGNTETDVPSSSYPHSRPPSRSANRTASNAVPSAVIGPRPLRSVSQGPQTNEPSTRPPSVAHYSVPPSPAHPANGTPPKAGHTHGSSPSAQPSPKYAQLHGVSPNHFTSTQVPSAPPVHSTPINVPQTFATSSRPSTRDGTYTDAPYAHQQSVDRQPTTDNSAELRQTPNSTTVKASWVVQTPATAKRAKISREDKYLRDYSNLDTPQAQLRQVLSQDDDPFPHASSSMMKASQATTPLSSSQRSSFGTRSRDVSFGTPRGMSGSSSPRSGSAKEAPTPVHVPRQNLPPHLAGPPQIAVVGATPVSMAFDLPQGRVDHTLLAPPFPAPPRTSRTTSSSQDQRSQPSPPVVRNVSSSSSYQPQPTLAAHAPSLFQPYQPPSPPAPEDSGQFSPPPLPIPPPRGPEDSPPPPIETRISEIIPTRSQSDGTPQNNVHSVPEVESEMFHLPSQPSALPQLFPVPPPHAAQTWQASKLGSDMVSTTTLNGSAAVAHVDPMSSKPVFTQLDDVQIVHQEIIKSTSVLPSQSSAPPTRSRPKVTVEDIPDSPVLSKGIPTSVSTMTPSASESRPVQPSQNTTFANASSTSKSTAADQPGHKNSPQSRSKDAFLHRNLGPNPLPAAPPMPPPTPAVAPIPARVPSSAPPTLPIFPSSSQAPPAQRATSHAVPPRTYQRAAEMMQASKSTSAGTNAGGTGNVGKPTAPPIQTTYNPVSTIIGASAQVAPRPVNAPHSSASITVSTSKVSASAMTSSGPLVGAPGPHTSAPSTSINTQPPSAFDLSKSRPGPLSIPFVDATPTTVMSTTTVKNTHQEQPIVDTARPRDVTSSTTRNFPSSSHIYPTSTRPGISSVTTQQPHVTLAQPSTHYRAVSLPVTTSSSAAQKPPSPRKYSQPIPSAAVSSQPFPSRLAPPEPQSTHVPVSGYLSTPAPVRSARLPSSDYTNDSDMLKTPSSIAPSPMLNPDSNAGPQSIAVPIRARQVSTDSKDEKKRGLFGLFRTRTLSSKAADPPPVSSVPRASLDQARAHPDAPTAASTTTPVSRGVTSTSAPKGLHSFPAPINPASTRTGTQPKSKGRVLDPITIPPPLTHTGREHKDATPHLFTPFKFLTMHSKRNRTVSAASLDVCDGNTATNTVIGSPDHSTVSQVQPLPAIIPPGVRDPLIATSEWRDREEAHRRERKNNRVRRPGVTFDLEEEPPSPAPGTASKRKKLVRRPSGRAPTPGPPRG